MQDVTFGCFIFTYIIAFIAVDLYDNEGVPAVASSDSLHKADSSLVNSVHTLQQGDDVTENSVKDSERSHSVLSTISKNTISSVALDSEVGAVISISEISDSRNVENNSSHPARENLPPVPKLIHATTLEALTTVNRKAKLSVSSCETDESKTQESSECLGSPIQQCIEENIENTVKEEAGTVDISLTIAEESISANEKETEQELESAVSDPNVQANDAAASVETVEIFKHPSTISIANVKELPQARNTSDSKTSMNRYIPHLNNNESYIPCPPMGVSTSMETPSVPVLIHNVQVNYDNLHLPEPKIPANIRKIGQTMQIRQTIPSMNAGMDTTRQMQYVSHRVAPPREQYPFSMRNGQQQQYVPLSQGVNELGIIKRRRDFEKEQLEAALKFEKALQEYKTIEKMTQVKDKEREHLQLLKEKKWRELSTIKPAPIIPPPLSPTRSQVRKTEPVDNLMVPPPAHQNKKENVLEILDKLDRSVPSIASGGMKHSSPYNIRTTPVLDAPHDITLGSKGCHANQDINVRSYHDNANADHIAAKLNRSGNRSSSAPAQWQPDRSAFHRTNAPGSRPGLPIVISPHVDERGQKRPYSSDNPKVSCVTGAVPFVTENRIQEELHAAIALKRQRIDALTNGNGLRHDGFIDAPNSSNQHQKFRRIAPAPDNQNSVPQTQQRHTLPVSPQECAIITKELLAKRSASVNNQTPYMGHFRLQRPNGFFPSANSSNVVGSPRFPSLNGAPSRPNRPQTVRLLGAAAMPNCRFPAQASTQQGYQGQLSTIRKQLASSAKVYQQPINGE